jgi:hypothetical protein
MNNERTRILEMLATGKISVTEAEQLLAALTAESASGAAIEPSANPATATRAQPKYLRVMVNDEADRVNIRVPLGLIRAGMQLGALLPSAAREKIQRKMADNGVDLDLGNIGANTEQLLEQIGELSLDIEDGEKSKVRIFCE